MIARSISKDFGYGLETGLGEKPARLELRLASPASKNGHFIYHIGLKNSKGQDIGSYGWYIVPEDVINPVNWVGVEAMMLSINFGCPVVGFYESKNVFRYERAIKN